LNKYPTNLISFEYERVCSPKIKLQNMVLGIMICLQTNGEMINPNTKSLIIVLNSKHLEH
jgi:ssRNA-specific RNase YbeY (16S rRNA maturation enzyme)